ncbi:MAG: MoaD/ThiS family protein [Candidatus Thorarchaeota archaeon]|jgi:molybdopterin converting factor small subunit
MKITVRLRGPLAKALKESHVTLAPAVGSTVRDAIGALLESNDSIRQVWHSPEHVDREALVLCNGADIGLSGGMETELSDGDEIVVLPLIHGGV